MQLVENTSRLLHAVMDNDKKTNEALKNALEKIEERDKHSSGIVREMLIGAFKTKLKAIVWIAWIYSVIFLGTSVFLGYRAFAATDIRETILYSAGTIISVGILATVKQIYISMVNRSAIEREIKRLELRIVKEQTLLQLEDK